MAREYQIWNRGNNYFDSMLSELMFNEQYPQGTTQRKQVGGEWTDVPRAPEFQSGTEAEKEARRRSMAGASAKEDLALKGALGGSRKLREGETMPKGAYALANYPGLQSAVEWAATGNLPGGSASIGMWLKEQNDMKLRLENSQKRKEWAANQRALLGGW